MSLRRLAWGAVVAAVYLAAVSGLGGSGPPARLLYDGLAPPIPYRWVNPPPEFAAGNKAPESLRHSIPLRASGSEAASPSTPDGQVTVTFDEGTFPPRTGARSVAIAVDPLDPSTLGPPPSGLAYQGNAYVVAASYRPVASPAEPGRPVTVLLRYPARGTRIFHLESGEWVALLPTTSIAASLQVYADSRELGTFVVAATPHAVSTGHGRPWLPFVAVGAAVAGAAVAGVLRLRQSRRRASRARARGGRRR